MNSTHQTVAYNGATATKKVQSCFRTPQLNLAKASSILFPTNELPLDAHADGMVHGGAEETPAEGAASGRGSIGGLTATGRSPARGQGGAACVRAREALLHNNVHDVVGVTGQSASTPCPLPSALVHTRSETPGYCPGGGGLVDTASARFAGGHVFEPRHGQGLPLPRISSAKEGCL